MASKIGAGIFQNAYGHGANVVTAGQKDYQMRMMQIEKQREDYYRKLGTPPGVPTMKGATAEPENTHEGYNTIIKELGDHSVPDGWIQRPKRNAVPGTPPGPPVQWDKAEDPDDVQPGYGYVPADTAHHEDIFYYHSDHLGSTSYITDAKANVAQFDAYLPYGELLVDEHSSTEEMPYKFNGKELDEETGLYYYGARYMNPKTSLWYGVDALAEKYVSTDCYVYCIDNPVKFIDSDGNDIFLIVWASHDGRIGHAGIAISNYKEVKSKVKVNGRWTTQVRMVQDGTYTYRVLWPGGEGAGKQNFDKDLPVDEKLSSKVKATTPNLIFKASRRIRGNQVLKNLGSKINNSFIHAVSGGVLNKNLQKKRWIDKSIGVFSIETPKLLYTLKYVLCH